MLVEQRLSLWKIGELWGWTNYTRYVWRLWVPPVGTPVHGCFSGVPMWVSPMGRTY